MHVLISGGTGLVGTKLTERLIEKGHSVTILTRNAKDKQNQSHIHYVTWLDGSKPENHLENVDAVVNLAGASISKPWTRSHKEAILKSRVEATQECIRIIRALEHTPSVFYSSSAIGYYGVSEEDTFTEHSKPINQYFLQTVSEQWESEASQVKDEVRLVIGRLGLVLDRNDGPLPLMALPYRFGVGGRIGNGRQWYSWIHVEDAANVIVFSLENEQCEGPFNITAPEPLRMRKFGQIIGETLHRPHWLPAPRFAMRLALGEMSDLIIKGQRVIPKRTEELGFSYRFPTLRKALKDIYS
ncbi:TIGR01777 family oxidoreductase [Geomicrobium sp. JCM 19038]|uniref:TIGR01777 family oxidoreductase n=1 Tax=Geomicrobium sp. JCM 19038 TaxID=1460635 RepID=UPI00045F29F1|nr:TIGR01777 family oxidoreductase [Geomicrobium sp. JCM 19038]GAK10325.1 cell division inhibitor [Geomicrobium sp. JCM 19038]